MLVGRVEGFVRGWEEFLRGFVLFLVRRRILVWYFFFKSMCGGILFGVSSIHMRELRHCGKACTVYTYVFLT